MQSPVRRPSSLTLRQPGRPLDKSRSTSQSGLATCVYAMAHSAHCGGCFLLLPIEAVDVIHEDHDALARLVEEPLDARPEGVQAHVGQRVAQPLRRTVGPDLHAAQ